MINQCTQYVERNDMVSVLPHVHFDDFLIAANVKVMVLCDVMLFT
jgi:hypothetical protein